MEKLDKEVRLWIILSCLLVFFLALFAGIFFSSLSRKSRSLEEELDKSEKVFREHKLPPQEAPLQVRIKLLQQRNRKMIEAYRRFENKLEISLAPGGGGSSRIERPVYFKKHLYSIRKELKSRTSSRGMRIPPSLGFSDKIPSEEEAPRLLRQLEIVKNLVEAAMISRVDSILSINCLPPLARSDEETSVIFLKEFPIELNMVSSLEALFRFLYEVQKEGEFFGVERISIESNFPKRTEKVKVNLVMSAFEFIGETPSANEIPPVTKKRNWVKPKGY